MVHHHIYPLFIFDLGVKVTQNIAQYPQIHHVTLLQSLKWLCPTVSEEMHLQENTLFDFGIKVT